MVSDYAVKLCQAGPTVSSELGKVPTQTPTEIAQRLYGHHKHSTNQQASGPNRPSASEHDLQRARQCGNWGPGEPSELFLRIFHDALCTLDADPLGGMCSPPLLGSYGTVPLTVIAPLEDIFRHMSNLIVRAEKEVVMVTCSWAPSAASRFISDALKELSMRAGKKSERAVVKIMFDKAGAANFLDPRQMVKPETYSGKAIQLPKPEEIPNLDLQVMNIHKPLLGTLHAKFMIVDRKIGVIESNNTEDNDNLEMMTHLEGPIVDSLYDTALLTWGNAFTPSIPSSASHPNDGDSTTKNPTDAGEPIFMDRPAAREQQQVVSDGTSAQLPPHMPGSPHYDATLASEITRMQSAYSPHPDESRLQATTRQLNQGCPKPIPATSPPIPQNSEFTPYIPTSLSTPAPMALVSRPPFGPPTNTNVYTPQNEAWLSALRHARHTVFIQTPDLNAPPLHAAIAAALARGVEITYYVCLGYNDAGELMPGQGGTNEMFAKTLVASLPAESRKRLHIGYYVGKDQIRPIHQSFHARSCHVKLLIADGHVAIQGSGNMDTQSWFHSQEINVLVDSEEVVRKWREGIERNQATGEYGMVKDGEGVWRGEGGREVDGSSGAPGRVEGYFKGAWGMMGKLRSKGGFA